MTICLSSNHFGKAFQRTWFYQITLNNWPGDTSMKDIVVLQESKIASTGFPFWNLNVTWHTRWNFSHILYVHLENGSYTVFGKRMSLRERFLFQLQANQEPLGSSATLSTGSLSLPSHLNLQLPPLASQRNLVGVVIYNLMKNDQTGSFFQAGSAKMSDLKCQ